MPNLQCPFDGNDLTRLEGRYNNPYYVCPNCGEEYSRYEVNNLQATKTRRVASWKRELDQINSRLPNLLTLLELAGESPSELSQPSCTEPCNIPHQPGSYTEGRLFFEPKQTPPKCTESEVLADEIESGSLDSKDFLEE